MSEEKRTECYCDEDQGAGYTFSDKHGACDVCEKEEELNQPLVANCGLTEAMFSQGFEKSGEPNPYNK